MAMCDDTGITRLPLACTLRDKGKRTFSINFPIPDCVIERPPNICAASSAVARPVLVTYLDKDPSLSHHDGWIGSEMLTA